MTNENTTKVKQISELREVLRRECTNQVARAAEAALATRFEPRWTYRIRLLQAVIAAAPDLSERVLFNAWKTDPQLASFATQIHHGICDMRLWRLTDTVNKWANDEVMNQEEHRAWSEQISNHA